MVIINTHTHTRLTALCPGLPGWAGTRKVKLIWILLKQETLSGSGISWAIRKSAPRFRQITMPAPHQSVFTGHMPFLPPNQQHQSTEMNIIMNNYYVTLLLHCYLHHCWQILMSQNSASTCCIDKLNATFSQSFCLTTAEGRDQSGSAIESWWCKAIAAWR